MGIVRSSWDHFIIAKRERLWRRAVLSLGISIAAAVSITPLAWASFLAAYAICGDQSDAQCGPQPWTAYLPAMIFVGLMAIAALAAVASLIRALVLIAFALRSKLGQHSER